jgi:hypothetical protein
MELADNDDSDEEEEDDWGKGHEEKEQKSSHKKKKPKTEIPMATMTTVAKSKPIPKTKQHATPTKTKSTFVKPLPLHIQTLGPLKSSSSTKSAPSIESLLASMPSRESSHSSISNGTSSASTTHSPPDTFSIEILSWASVILRDAQLQSLCHQYLISLLYQLYERSSLPNEDDPFQNALLLCQFSLSSDCHFHEINSTLLRKILPLIMLLTIDSNHELLEGNKEGDQGDEGDDEENQQIENLMKVYRENNEVIRPGGGLGGGGRSGSSGYLESSLVQEFIVKTLSSFKGKFHQTNLALNSMKSDASLILGRVSGVEE